jgi:hypothetical protein
MAQPAATIVGREAELALDDARAELARCAR